ncbi:hypothetical protein HG535_0E00640 [Zygotorulaspora mrakii]|uniref:Aminodeoxychorismate lyase n=1 Tax=Zygotorulaspora mrakii TaxID=42260 RepID=A0A7H9B2X8_ZYGMR|nr:uncharacterized protein HG535_0E00640 [Zygotorulaspora mrakii]QLG72980.1 hypothetical protein HG535_0E00640 [Zygotorulaspora mrakii]
MGPKKNNNTKPLTASQQKILKILQTDIVERYFNPAESDADFELLSTLRYDPGFTHVFLQSGKESHEIRLEEIDYRLQADSFADALNNAESGSEGNTTRFSDIFDELTTSSSFDNENDNSLMSLLESTYESQNSSPPAPASFAASQQENTDLRATFFQRFLLLGEHYKRLNFALQFFKWEFHVPLKMLLDKLIDALPEHHEISNLEERMKLLINENHCYKMRVLISKTGRMRIEAHPILPTLPLTPAITSSRYFMETILGGFLPNSSTTWDVFVDTKPMSVSPFTTFKTTYRDHYNEARGRLEELASTFGSNGKREILVYNDAHQLMEGSITNVALVKTREDNDEQLRFITPSLNSGCLCGTMRHYLLKKYLICEEPIDVRHLVQGDTVILFNGVMGAVKGVVRNALK